MTKKLTVSVPDDVADRLSHEDNVSGYVTESVRRRMLSERVREQLRDAGFKVTEEGLAKVDAQMRRLEESITPELERKLWRQAQELRANVRSHWA